MSMKRKRQDKQLESEKKTKTDETDETDKTDKTKKDDKVQTRIQDHMPTTSLVFVKPDDPILKKLTTLTQMTCTICSSFVWDAYVPPCEHSICKLCCESFFQRKNTAASHRKPDLRMTNKCPLCKDKQYRYRDYVPLLKKSSTLQALLSDVEIYCPMEENRIAGCNWKGTYTDAIRHAETCQFRLEHCNTCKKWISIDSLTQHKKQCFVPFECPQCYTVYKPTSKQDLQVYKEKHKEQCVMIKIKCTSDGCGIMVRRRDLQTHLQHCECAVSHVCPFVCSVITPSSAKEAKVSKKFKLNELIQHLQECHSTEPLQPLHLEKYNLMLKLNIIYQASLQKTVALCSRYHVMHPCFLTGPRPCERDENNIHLYRCYKCKISPTIDQHYMYHCDHKDCHYFYCSSCMDYARLVSEDDDYLEHSIPQDLLPPEGLPSEFRSMFLNALLSTNMPHSPSSSSSSSSSSTPNTVVGVMYHS
jgi:hypothetical protein